MASRARKYAKKTTVINFRIQPSTKALLDEAARRSGRTMSAECEHQLRRALVDMGAGPTFAIMSLVGRTIVGVVGPKTKWWNDPRQFDEAVRLAHAAFGLLRPPPRAGAEPPAGGEPLSERSIQFAAEASVREAQAVDTAVPFEKQTDDQRWLAHLRQDLGPVVDRALVWGFSAQETRRLRESTRSYLPELQALTKKGGKEPLTQAEAERLAELQRKLLEAARPKGESNAR
jgi:hypothetical protein